MRTDSLLFHVSTSGDPFVAKMPSCNRRDSNRRFSLPTERASQLCRLKLQVRLKSKKASFHSSRRKVLNSIRRVQLQPRQPRKVLGKARLLRESSESRRPISHMQQLQFPVPQTNQKEGCPRTPNAAAAQL